jgi:predicted DNA-binding antitoxin AbrB/MazE fold protein
MAMTSSPFYSHVCAIYQKGGLKLLSPLDLPEGTQVDLTVAIAQEGLNFVPARELDKMTAVLPLGGNALKESEELYDSSST